MVPLSPLSIAKAAKYSIAYTSKKVILPIVAVMINARMHLDNYSRQKLLYFLINDYYKENVIPYADVGSTLFIMNAGELHSKREKHLASFALCT